LAKNNKSPDGRGATKKQAANERVSAAAEERPAAAERQVKMENKQCSICLRHFTEFGNSAWPINNGRCCNVCNDNVVIPARIRMQRRKETEAKDQP
jgi:hypothetical protein